MKTEGGCLCKNIRYAISGTPLASAVCHCQSCRRASAAPSVAWITVNVEDLQFTTGQPAVYRSSPPVARGFCNFCGSQLTYQHADDRDTIDVTTASLDQPDLFPPTKEIWLEDKIRWEAANPSLRYYPRGGNS